MYPIADIDDNNLRVASHFDGLLAYLIWSPVHKVFEAKVKSAYEEIHDTSGGSMVILAGSADWVSDAQKKRFQADVQRERAFAGFALAASSGGMSLSKTLTTLAERFNLKSGDLPALVFVTEPGGKSAHTFNIDRKLISSTNDEVEQELLEIFEAVKEVVGEDPCHISPHQSETSVDHHNELIAWREKRMELLTPILDARDNLTFLKKHSGKLVRGVRILSPFLGAL